MRNFIVYILLLLILLGLYINQCKKYSNGLEEKFSNNKSNIIPKVIIQTYYDKSKIPIKIFNNIKKYAPEYKHIIFDDAECIDFLKKNYKDKVLQRFISLKRGAHKADLFRYCYLYINGGVYLDIKTELIKPLSNIFNENYLYTVIANNNKSIYQGIIATHPGNIIFLKLIKYILETTNEQCKKKYLIFVFDFYNKLEEYLGSKPHRGLNTSKINNNKVMLLKEKCTNKHDILSKDCNKLDRYNLCCFIFDENDNKIIKVRYPDYPF